MSELMYTHLTRECPCGCGVRFWKKEFFNIEETITDGHQGRGDPVLCDNCGCLSQNSSGVKCARCIILELRGNPDSQMDEDIYYGVPGAPMPPNITKILSVCRLCGNTVRGYSGRICVGCNIEPYEHCNLKPCKSRG